MFGVICANRPVQTNLQILSPTQFILIIPPDPPFTHIVIFLLPDQILPPNSGAGVYIRFPPPPTPPLPSYNNNNNTQQQPEFKFLGAISNDKPSAIYRVSDRRVNNNNNDNDKIPDFKDGPIVELPDDDVKDDDQDAMMDSSSSATNTTTAPTDPNDPNQNITLGISLEPLETINAQLALLEQQQQQQTSSTSTPPLRPSSSSTTTTVITKPPLTTKMIAQRIIQNAFNYVASFSVKSVDGEEMIPLKAFRDWWARFEKKITLDEGFLERDDGG